MGKKLYVGNLSYNTTEEALNTAFAQAGKVESAKIITDKMTNKSKGFGFVEMATEDEAKKAIEIMNNAEIDGRNLRVNEARTEQPRPKSNRFSQSNSRY